MNLEQKSNMVQDIESTQTYVDQQDSQNLESNEDTAIINATDDFKAEMMKDFPLQKIHTNGDYYAMMGSYKVTETFKSEEELLDVLYGIGIKGEQSWNTLLWIISAYLDQTADIRERNRKEMKGENK